MGFYPVCPGKPEYDIGSPLFDEVRIHLPGGKTFTVRAENNSPRAKYIQSAEMNGKPLERAFLSHEDILSSATLTLRMGERPNRAWAAEGR